MGVCPSFPLRLVSWTFLFLKTAVFALENGLFQKYMARGAGVL